MPEGVGWSGGEERQKQAEAGNSTAAVSLGYGGWVGRGESCGGAEAVH